MLHFGREGGHVSGFEHLGKGWGELRQTTDRQPQKSEVVERVSFHSWFFCGYTYTYMYVYIYIYIYIYIYATYVCMHVGMFAHVHLSRCLSFVH